MLIFAAKKWAKNPGQPAYVALVWRWSSASANSPRWNHSPGSNAVVRMGGASGAPDLAMTSSRNGPDRHGTRRSPAESQRYSRHRGWKA